MTRHLPKPLHCFIMETLTGAHQGNQYVGHCAKRGLLDPALAAAWGLVRLSNIAAFMRIASTGTTQGFDQGGNI